MTQFVFTAGTIHLLRTANSESLGSHTASVNGCIAVLHSMGQTWRCASQSGDVLQQLLLEWHPRLVSPDKTPATGAQLNISSGVSVEKMLQQNPEFVQQLQQLGWSPPRSGTTASSSFSAPALETILMDPSRMVSINLIPRLMNTSVPS